LSSSFPGGLLGFCKGWVIRWDVFNTPALIRPNLPRRSTHLMPIQPPISTIPCKILYLLANPVLPSPMFSSPANSPTNRSPLPHSFHSNRCHPERTEGSAFRLPPLSAPSAFLASPLFSYSCALFCRNESDKLFVFRQLHTLFSKHPGGGYPLQPAIFSFRNLTTRYSLLSTISFTIRTYEKRARNCRRIRTSKTQDLKLFRMNTYKNTGRGTPTQNLAHPSSWLAEARFVPWPPKSARPEDHSAPPRHQPPVTTYRSPLAASRIQQAGV
jgi:hypothetical protein